MSSQNLSLNFWGTYEVDFPEGPNMKAPGECEYPFGAYFFAVLQLPLNYKYQVNFL